MPFKIKGRGNKEYNRTVLEGGSVCFGDNTTTDDRQHRTCVAVNAGPVALLGTGQPVFLGVSFPAFLSAVHPEMPSVTMEANAARLAIIAVGTVAAEASVVGIASVLPAGFVSVLGYHIDGIVAAVWCFITFVFVCILDTYLHDTQPKVVKRRAEAAEAAQKAGKESKRHSSTIVRAFKKATPVALGTTIFLLYGTVVPRAFAAAETIDIKIVVYFFALVFKTAGEMALKHVFEHTKMDELTIKLGLFAYELVTATQCRILLASYEETNTVLGESYCQVAVCYRAAGLWSYHTEKGYVQFSLTVSQLSALSHNVRFLPHYNAPLYSSTLENSTRQASPSPLPSTSSPSAPAPSSSFVPTAGT